MDYNLIWERIRQRDESALKIVFDLYYEDLVNFATSYIFDHHQSQDLVQECYLALWEKAPKLHIKSSLKPYLYGMVRNKCLDYLQSLQITDSNNYLDVLAGLEDSTYMETSPHENTDHLIEMVNKVMDTMPKQMRRIFEMKYLEDCSYQDIATACNISLNSVKTQLKRAKLKIVRAMLLLCLFFYLTQGQPKPSFCGAGNIFFTFF